MLITVIAIVIILGLLIFVHEFGHFIAAKKSGMKVEEFGFGFPPRAVGFYKNPKTKKFVWLFGKGKNSLMQVAGGKPKKENKDSEENISSTIYSLNWLPLGGFCKILGEQGEDKKNNQSFASKKPWVRIVVLASGVAMNFVLAALLLMIGFKIGLPTAIDKSNENLAKDVKIQLMTVAPNSPAADANLKVGDQILSINNKNIKTLDNVQKIIDKNKGKQIDLKIKRINQEQDIKVTPRKNPPKGEGALGIGMVSTGIISYPWYTSIWKGISATLTLTIAIIVAFFDLIKNFITGQKISAEIAGPIGIAVLTSQVTKMGFVYVLQFAALLSINLGIINILPFPALDGGRILFILIEKIRRKPVSQKIENAIHTAGFVLLIALMIVVTFKDITKFKDVFINLWNKIF